MPIFVLAIGCVLTCSACVCRCGAVPSLDLKSWFSLSAGVLSSPADLNHPQSEVFSGSDVGVAGQSRSNVQFYHSGTGISGKIIEISASSSFAVFSMATSSAFIFTTWLSISSSGCVVHGYCCHVKFFLCCFFLFLFPDAVGLGRC